MKKLSFSRRRNGFTLIEVMITVAIVAILIVVLSGLVVLFRRRGWL